MRYAPIPANEIEPGLRVVLVSDQDGDYDIADSNPLIGTEYECEGVIEEVTPDEIYVEWDNGSHNVYVEGDLGYASNDHMPGGRCSSIW